MRREHQELGPEGSLQLKKATSATVFFHVFCELEEWMELKGIEVYKGLNVNVLYIG